MTSQLETVTEACRQIARHVREHYRNLHIHYIVHRSGQRKEALAMAAQEIIVHPAAETALHMLQKVRRSEESAVIGTAIARKPLFLGLASQDSILSLCTINLEQFENLKDVRRYAWHLAWHAIDAVLYYHHPDNRAAQLSDVIVRRRNALEMAGANLRADTFSAIVSALGGDSQASSALAKMRGLSALRTRSLHNPEFYPYILAKEATDFAIRDLLKRSPSRRRFIPLAMKNTANIGLMIDNDMLRQWLSFSEPAQDMAWRGFPPEDVLGAAVNTSENTSVRAMGYLLSEITGIQPRAAGQGDGSGYSPYADDKFNAELHEKAISSIFEDLIGQGIRQGSADPFIFAANQQNESLTEGQILGWCASALQAAGRAFARGLEYGHEAEDIARREFHGERTAVSWGSLRKLGRSIVNEYRHGHMVTLSRVEQLCADDKALSSIRKAVAGTMRDPNYQRKLNAAMDINAELRPQPRQEKTPRNAPSTPVPANVPSPGGGRIQGAKQTVPVSDSASETQEEKN